MRGRRRRRVRGEEVGEGSQKDSLHNFARELTMACSNHHPTSTATALTTSILPSNSLLASLMAWRGEMRRVPYSVARSFRPRNVACSSVTPAWTHTQQQTSVDKVRTMQVRHTRNLTTNGRDRVGGDWGNRRECGRVLLCEGVCDVFYQINFS